MNIEEFINSMPDYYCQFRYWYYSNNEVVLQVAFIPLEECDEVATNVFLWMAADSVMKSYEFDSDEFIFNEEANLKDLLEYDYLNFTFFLKFPNLDNMNQYINKMIKLEIF